MESIKNEDLKLTKEGFFRLFNGFRKEGMSIQMAFNKVDAICHSRGCQNYYNNFYSLKSAIYTGVKK